jgi:cytoskeletal protein RodZ
LGWNDSISPRMDGNFTETLGQYLRREREARSVSLEELSRGTRISRPSLEALERDDFHFFSKREYTLGFLRGYARHLGLDPDEVLKRYRIQWELTSRKETFEQIPLFSTSKPITEEISDSAKVPASAPAKEPKPWRSGIFIQLVIVLAAIGFTLYFQHLLKQAENREKSPGHGGRVSSEKEATVHFKASGQNQSIAQEAQEHRGERSKDTSSAKSTSAGKQGKAREDGEAGKDPPRQASP